MAGEKEVEVEEKEVVVDDKGKKEVEVDDETDTDEKLEPKAQIAKLNAENTKRRLNEKALKAENLKLKEDQARKDKALEILTGKKVAGDIDPIEKANQENNARQKRLLIRAELGTVAKDAHDPGTLYKLFPEKFKDFDVDLETDTVNRDDLKEIVQSIRKENPYLFMAKKAAVAAKVEGGALNVDGGAASGGGNHRAQWNALKASGDKKAAQEYYNKNSKLILAQMSSK